MVREACAAYGYEVSPELEEEFKLHKTHNDGVFSAYTPEIRAARHCGIITAVDSTILNARSMESAVGCTATGLLDFDNPSAGPEAVISSEPAAIEYKREEDGEAAEDPHETSEEVAEDPVG